MTSLLPSAVLWDLDGTIVDSEPYWHVAEAELLGRFGVAWSEEFAVTLIGQALPTAAVMLIDEGVRMSVPDIVDEMCRMVIDQLVRGAAWRPGALELLVGLREAGVPSALVTMSYRNVAEAVIEKLTSDLGFMPFDAVVTGDSVTRGKPDPEAYLLGASLLGVPIEDCVAFEDSPTGLAAAVASGAVSIVIPHNAEVPASDAHLEWSGLGGRSVDDVALAFTTRRHSLADSSHTGGSR